mmetsp:Transcript_22777/g.45807  ORF Transcript_22777/g.45807 Transcript_22777/m.45807 type:complete len:247 (+) Transcript_22777:1819-2559(+)
MDDEVGAKVDVLSQVSRYVLVVTRDHLHIDHHRANVLDRFHGGFARRIFDGQDASQDHLHLGSFIEHVYSYRKRLVAALAKNLINPMGYGLNFLEILDGPFDAPRILRLVAVKNLGEESLGDFQMFRELRRGAFHACDRAVRALHVWVEPMIDIPFRAIALVVVVNPLFPFFLQLCESIEHRFLHLVFLRVFEGRAERSELHNVFFPEISFHLLDRIIDPYLLEVDGHVCCGEGARLVRAQEIHRR